MGDRWTGLIRTVFERCKLAWRYRVPAEAAARRELRALCAGLLPFETHLLSLYRAPLLAWLGSEDAERQAFAARLLGLVVLSDPEIIDRLRGLTAGGSAEVQRAARAALTTIQQTPLTTASRRLSSCPNSS